jgi:hypothetical protein
MIERSYLEAIRQGRTRPEDLASIVIPHYRTEDLVRLCLRSIRRLTDHPYEAIVVDNHSADGSLEYLRRVGWIRLIERGPEAGPDGVAAHASAMDLGLAAARGRWLVSLHSDTIVRRDGWLGDLLGRLRAAAGAACLGSGKFDADPPWYRAVKRLDPRRLWAGLRRLAGLGPPPAQPWPEWYPRTYCAIYDLACLRRLGLSFAATPGFAAGERLYHGLLEAGHAAVRLTPQEVAAYVDHVSHATALVARGGLGHWRGNHKVRRAIKRVMQTDLARRLLADPTLDA